MDSMMLVMTFPIDILDYLFEKCHNLSNLLYKENLNEEESKRP